MFSLVRRRCPGQSRWSPHAVTSVLPAAVRASDAGATYSAAGGWLHDNPVGGVQVSQAQPDRQAVHDELERARHAFHEMVRDASPAALRRRTDGTRWTNRQLLFHMLLGYLVVRTLLPLVRTLGRLPDRVSLTFARVLNAGTRPFHLVNYLGACGGALVLHDRRLIARVDRTIAALHRQLDQETDASLALRMHFPTGWDPYFADTMSVLEVYHYGTQHFDHHRRQLTLDLPRR